MKVNGIFVLCFTAVLLIFNSCSETVADNNTSAENQVLIQDLHIANYIAAIDSFRKQKDIESVSDTIHSPFTREQQKDFDGLKYFDPDASFLLKAHVQITGDTVRKPFATASGKTKYYYNYARLTFKINDTLRVLNGYTRSPENESNDPLFVPFKDYTSGNETYGGGRYLDIFVNNQDSIELDFNVCYNPYCAYSDGWSCSIPPKENELACYIRAGEKTFHTAEEELH